LAAKFLKVCTSAGRLIVSTAAATTLAVGDVYSVKAALPVRYQPNAKWVGAGPTLDKVYRLSGRGRGATPPGYLARNKGTRS
jgi:hypothetical protein